MGRDLDDTVVMRPGGPRNKSRVSRVPWIVAGVVGVVLAGGGGWFALAPHTPATSPAQAPASRSVAAVLPPVIVAAPLTAPAPAPALAPAPAALVAVVPHAPPAASSAPVLAAFAPPPILAPEPAAVQLPNATEAEILADAPTSFNAGRFAPQPEIVVVQFGSLGEQARTLNRAAAMIERAGFPRDRPLANAELDSRIRAGGNSPDNLYYGHDYRAMDLLRFFEEAEHAGLLLTDQELTLKREMRRWGWRPGTNGALISLVRDDPSTGVDRGARATVLRHELSHGLYFVSPVYAGYVKQFWTSVLTSAERSHFRGFLRSEGYDTEIEDLVMNETQAYLMHTQDTRFFTAEAVGIAAPRLDALRVLFLTGMPPSWLRDCTTVPAPIPTTARAMAPAGVPGTVPGRAVK